MEFDFKTGKIKVDRKRLPTLLYSDLSDANINHEVLPRPQDWATQRADYIESLGETGVEVVKEDARFIAVKYQGKVTAEQTTAMNRVINTYLR